MRLLFVHGRAQGKKEEDALKKEWISALEKGLSKTGLAMPAGLQVDMPFYGKMLDDFVDSEKANRSPLEAGIPVTQQQRDKLRIEEELARALLQNSNIPREELRKLQVEPQPEFFIDWLSQSELVQAIVRLIDSHSPDVMEGFLQLFMRDVALYLTHNEVRREINDKVGADLYDDTAVAVGHSLGSVVAYDVLREASAGRSLKPKYITVGSPLGLAPVRQNLGTLGNPAGADGWSNHYDERDIVALHPLDAINFPATPSISNDNSVDNRTDNRHGIVGYLDDADVAARIHHLLTDAVG